MKTLAVALFTVTSALAQVSQPLQSGSVQAVIDLYPEFDGERAVRVCTVSSDPAVVEFEITLFLSIDGVFVQRMAVQQRPKDRGMWIMQYFQIPASADVISFSILERRPAHTFMIDSGRKLRSSDSR